jgi:predicted Zn finger-like uncharacterized protein
MPVGNATLITRCPDCATAFRATPAQLALREGRVRCGNCGMVFDARENALASDPLPAPAALAQPEPTDLTPAEPAATSVTSDAALVPPDETSAREEQWGAWRTAVTPPDDQAVTGFVPADAEPSQATFANPGQPPAPDGEPDTAPTLDASVEPPVGMAPPEQAPPAGEFLVLEPAPAADTTATLPELRAEQAWDTRPLSDSRAGPEAGAGVKTGTAESAENLEFDFGRRRTTRRSLSPWLAWPAAILLLLGVIAQAAFSYRGDLALLFPVLKPHAEALCEALGCRVPLPRRAELLSIEASDLQADSAHPGVMVLTASLRNRAPFAQTPPALELTLTDTQDQPVARRVLTAADYLGPGTLAGSGASALIPAGTEIPVKVFFDASALKATGYRLYLFYP